MAGLFGKLKRVGTTPQKFQFTLCLEEFRLTKNISDLCPNDQGLEDLMVMFIWKRGPRSAASKPVMVGDPTICRMVSWKEQQLNLICTLYQDSKKGAFLDKKSEISFRVFCKGGENDPREIAQATLNLGKYAGIDTTVTDETEVKKTKDRGAKIKFTLSSKWIKELGGDEDSASVAEQEDDDESFDEKESHSHTGESRGTSKSVTSDSATPATESTPAVAAADSDDAPPLVHASVTSPEAKSASHQDKGGKNHILEAELKDLQKQKEKLEKANKDLKHKLQKKEEEFIALGSIRGERDLALGKVSKLQDEIKQLQNDMKKAPNTGQMSELKSQADELRDKYDALLVEKRAIEEKANELHLEAEKNENEIAKMKEQIDELTENDKENKEDLNALVEEVKKLRVELTAKQNETDTYKAKHKETETSLQEAQQKIATYEEQLKNLDEFKSTLEGQKDKAEKQREKAVRELEKLQAIVGEWEVKLVNLKVELVNTVDKLNTQEVENLHLKESLSKLMNLTAGKKKK
jgi:uncharacterized coiled-coil DUF342 family protein